jgi:hypothetical protein
MNSVIKNIQSNICMTEKEIDLATDAAEYIGTLPNQVCLETEHIINDGVYYRTLFIPAGHVAAGVKITIDTTIIVSGHIKLFIGDRIEELTGYNVITAKGNRRQVGFAIEDTYMTMCFPTSAKTVEEAEEEFTDEVDKLMTRRNLIKE